MRCWHRAASLLLLVAGVMAPTSKSSSTAPSPNRTWASARRLQCQRHRPQGQTPALSPQANAYRQRRQIFQRASQRVTRRGRNHIMIATIWRAPLDPGDGHHSLARSTWPGQVPGLSRDAKSGGWPRCAGMVDRLLSEPAPADKVKGADGADLPARLGLDYATIDEAWDAWVVPPATPRPGDGAGRAGQPGLEGGNC